MIIGPSGSGKELVARAIHAHSARKGGPFVTLNAATITPERMEIELFGTELNGGERKVGALEEAHKGILYLDEVADMPRETQSKILRVLVDQQFERVGGTKRVKVDVRIISSTAQNLEAMIAEGRFREDLYHRLAVVPVLVPGLAERREDIPFSSTTSCARWPAKQASSRAASATTPWPCCKRTTGRAMCGSCATTSKG